MVRWTEPGAGPGRTSATQLRRLASLGTLRAMPQRSPTPSEISAALAALGVYAQAPSDAELAEQAIAAGGENVLAAVLANALYGAAIGCGMLAEGVMLEQPTDRTRRLSLARAQALKASGAEGPGFVGAMHWQAAHIAGPLRALKDREQAPLGAGARRRLLGTGAAAAGDVSRRARPAQHSRRGDRGARRARAPS